MDSVDLKLVPAEVNAIFAKYATQNLNEQGEMEVSIRHHDIMNLVTGEEVDVPLVDHTDSLHLILAHIRQMLLNEALQFKTDDDDSGGIRRVFEEINVQRDGSISEVGDPLSFYPLNC